MSGDDSGGPARTSSSFAVEPWLRLLGEEALFGVLRRDGIVVFESAAVLHVLGYRPDEVVGKLGRMLLHPDELDAAWELANAAWAGSRGTRVLRCLHKDGSIRWMELQATKIDDEHLLFYRRDVSARRLAEQALQRSNDLLAAVMAIQAEYIESPGKIPCQKLVDAFVSCTDSEEGILVGLADQDGQPVTTVLARSELAIEPLRRLDGVVAELASSGVGASLLEPALLGLPIRGAENALLGAVVLSNPRAPYDPTVVESCRPLVLTAARLFESDRLRLRKDEAEQEAALLKTLAFVIAEAEDFDAALAVMVRTFVERTGWELGQAWRCTWDKRRVEPTGAWYTTDARYVPFRDASRKLSFAPGEGMIGRVWTTKTAAWVDEAEAEARGYPRVKVAKQVGLVASFCAPIVAAGEVVALLEFFSSRQRPEDRRTLELVSACAAQVVALLERKRTERGLQVLGTALGAMQVAATVTTRRGDSLVVEYANPAYKQLFGYSPSDVVGRDPTFLYGPGTDLARIAELRQDSAAGRPSRLELFLYDSEGKPHEVEISTTPVPNADGSEISHVTFWRDVGPIKQERAERAALESAVREADVAWRQTFDAIDLPILILAPSLRIDVLNRAAAETFGRQPHELCGQTLVELGCAPWTSVHPLLADVFATGKGRTVVVPDPAHRRSWDVTLDPLEDSRGVVVFARDVAEVESPAAVEVHAGALVELGRLVGGIAHEVRNPVFGISATLDAFAARFGARPDHEGYVRVLRGELARLTELTTDLVAYAKPPPLVLASHRIDELVNEAIGRCRRWATECSVHLEHQASTSALVSVDRGRVVQLFLALVEHAIRHASSGTTVVVRTGTATKHRVEVVVEYEGPEFPAPNLPRVFEPFFLRRAGGTGLALAIVQRIAEQHSGRVRAELRAAPGLAFTVTLPMEATDGQ